MVFQGDFYQLYAIQNNESGRDSLTEGEITAARYFHGLIACTMMPTTPGKNPHANPP